MKLQITDRWKMIRVLLFLAAMGITIYYGLFGYFDPPFDFPSDIRGPSDRHLHMAAFACLSWLLLIYRKNVTLAVIAIAGLAIALELVQVWMPARTPSLQDLFASLGGVALGWVLAIASNRFLMRSKGTEPS